MSKTIDAYYKTGIPLLDIIIGGAGIPVPSIMEFFGSEGGSKTTLALYLATKFLNNFENSEFIYIDAEFKLDEKRFNYIIYNSGIEKDRVEIIRSNIIEDIFDDLSKRLESNALEGKKTIIVLDSIANLMSKTNEGKGYSGAKDAAIIAGKLTELSYKIYRSKSQLILINQVRDNLQTGRGLRTPKGRYIKHISPIRVKISRDAKVTTKIGDLEIEEGIVVKLETEKNQMFIPRMTAKLFINNEKGVDELRSIFEQLKEYKIIQQSGAWSIFKYGDYNLKFRGYNEFKKKIKENPELLPLFAYLFYKRFVNISPLSKAKLIKDLWKYEEKFGFEKTELTDEEKKLLEYLEINND
jgi:recombination protein RecA